VDRAPSTTKRRDADTSESRDLHRAILRLMRELKVFSSRAENSGSQA
jgi:hypothetical protein